MNRPAFQLTDPVPLDLRPGVYRIHSSLAAEAVAARFSEGGWAAAVIDLGGKNDKAGIMEAFAEALAFPSWVGRNWDALDDALRDLSWWPTRPSGRLLLVRRRAAAAPGSATDHRDQLTLQDVLETAVDSWSRTDTPLVVLLAS